MQGIEGLFYDKEGGLDRILTELEEVLMTSDIGTKTTLEILDDVKTFAKESDLEAKDVKAILRTKLIGILEDSMRPLQTAKVKNEGDRNPTV